jgi:hypothetical protein
MESLLHFDGLNVQVGHIVGYITAAKTAFDFRIHQLFTSAENTEHVIYERILKVWVIFLPAQLFIVLSFR